MPPSSIKESDDESQRQSPATTTYPVDDGGLQAWTTVFGAWLVMFSTFGYLYSFGVYQDFYTRFFLSDHSQSKIGWIGSFQLAMPFACGLVSGKLFDAGHFHALEISGSVIFVVSLLTLSLAKPQEYFAVFLSQGLGMGLGLGLTFTPTVSIAVHYFSRRKVLATGIIMSGSSLGAVVFPIMINNLIEKIGFAKTVRASAYVALGCLLIGNAIMRTAYAARSTHPTPDIKGFFKEPTYLFACFGGLTALFGFYFPLLYLQLYAVEHGIDKTLAFYSIAVLNGGSTFGRVFGNYIGERLGPCNTIVPCTFVTAASIFAVFGIRDSASLVVVSLVYGVFSGAWLSLAVATLATLAHHPQEVGARIGIALALSSFGSLGATPVQGALLTSEFEWVKPIVFSGVMTVIAGFSFWMTRVLLVKERLTWKV